MCFRGKANVLKTDNGSEFAGKVMDRWALERNVEIDFSTPGKPTDNATAGILQRTTPAGMSQRKLILVTAGRQAENRIVAYAL